ncbi:cation:proton antiporter [Candidatus Methylocalor cossyra]|uniref:Potassium transporter KefB n=1 Tax=Candidatus Methylocalor cossyra TaxID=3108543 RepID=A0ABP1C455_9GAMM
MDESVLLWPAILLLLVGILAILLARPLRQSPIVGYLAAGTAIGPHGLGLVFPNPTTQLLADLGVVFLLFDIGLHFSLRRLWEARRDIFGLGPVQLVSCALALGGVGLALGLPPLTTFTVGATLALSSTAVVVQALAERNQQNCPVGLTATAVLVFQDVCAVFLLILAASPSDLETPPGRALAFAALKAALAFGGAILIGRYAVGPLFNGLARLRNDDVFTATALLLVLTAASATAGAGLSLTLGAFLAGMSMAETAFRPVLQTEVKPFRGLLLGFFFITVGMTLDAGVVMGHFAALMTLLVAVIGIKTLMIALTALVFRWSLAGSVQLGLLLAQGSELAFVIVGLPAVGTALGDPLRTLLSTAVALSLALTPLLATGGRILARQLRRRFAPRSEELVPKESLAPLVVLAMGDVGRTVADALEAHGLGYEAVEFDPDRFAAATADGYPVAFGDGADPRLMATLRMAERTAAVVTLPRYEVSAALTPLMHQRYPHLTRFIAVDTEEERPRYAALGMRAVVNRSVPRGLELAAAVLAAQGVDDERIHAWMRRQQERLLSGAAPPAPVA